MLKCTENPDILLTKEIIINVIQNPQSMNNTKNLFPEKFKKIAPYPDSEINNALQRIVEAKEFPAVSRFVFPEKHPEEVKNMLLRIHTSNDFQVQFMHKAVRRVVANSSDGLTFDGFDKLRANTPYLFIANHRDIVLDSAILQILLRENNLPGSEITFGSNLMMSPFIIDFGKINKMFTVFRGGNRQELLENSKLLSEYIRFTITETKESVWIAQRNGRTKDGNDKTEEGLLKMLNMSGKSSFPKNFNELNIIPLTIAYEIEPCARSKTNEMYISRTSDYIKQPGEDLKSILSGFTEHKGRIHMCAGKLIKLKDEAFENQSCKNDSFRKLVSIIDEQIHNNYKLFERNYIAFDELHHTTQYREFYTSEMKEKFLHDISNEISTLGGDKSILKQIYLEMYSAPVKNKNSH